ncbi:MAG: hypothetical protein ABIH72_01170 [archaeon]
MTNLYMENNWVDKYIINPALYTAVIVSLAVMLSKGIESLSDFSKIERNSRQSESKINLIIDNK